jgi:O-antigen/teichoic acid export membrane protein
MRVRADASSASSNPQKPPLGRERPRGSRDDLHELARGGMLSFVGTVAGGILSFALVVVITRGLGSAGTGVFFQSIALFTILETTARLGADTGLVRMVSRYRALGRTDDLAGTLLVGLGPVLAASVAFAIGMFVFGPQLAGVLAEPEHASQVATYLRALAPFLPLATGASVAVAATRGFGTVLPFVALERVGKPVLRPLLAIGVIALGMGSVALAVAWAVPVAIELPVALAIVAGLLHRAGARSPFLGRAAGLRRLAGDFWGFAAARGLAVLFQVLLLWSDVIIVGALRGAREAGIYAAVSRFALMGLFVIEAVRIVIAPQLSGLFARGEHDRAQHLYQVGTWWLIAASWPFYVIAALFAPVVLRVFGGQFVEGQAALLILSIAMLLMVGTGGVSVVLLMAGKSSWNLANTLAAVVVNVALNLVLIPRIGITGAALAWAAAILVEKGAALYQVWVVLRLSPFGNGYGAVCLTVLACFGALGLAARLLLGASVGALAVFGLVATVVYFLVLWRLRHLLELPILWTALRHRVAGGEESPVAAGVEEGA